jgi:hypothetical protein
MTRVEEVQEWMVKEREFGLDSRDMTRVEEV